MEKILLVEDDKRIIEMLTEYLKSEGFSVDSAMGQSLATNKLESNIYDLVLLDISLRDGNGFSVCSYIKTNYNIPVIFLTASGDEYSMITGLDMGADDYIPKPFSPRVLLSRIRSVLRRTGKINSVLEYKSIRVDTVKAEVIKNNKEIFLSALEYKLLLVFLNNKGIVLSRNKLLDEIWDSTGEYVNDNTLTVYIKRLREKIEDNIQKPNIIKTIRGLGYRLGD